MRTPASFDTDSSTARSRPGTTSIMMNALGICTSPRILTLRAAKLKPHLTALAGCSTPEYPTGGMIIAGCASGPSTERFRQRFAAMHPAHFRPFQDLWASSIGLGTYLGESDDATDARYAEAVESALAHGCNVFDTAINYRCQRSERALRRTVAALLSAGRVARDEFILCTKGGYLPFDGHVPADPGRYVVQTVLEPGLASYEDLVAGCHCLSPAYLDYTLRTSLRNLQVESVDVYFLHNPEPQLEEIDRD